MPDSISFLIAGHRFRVVGDRESALLRTMPGFPVFVSEYEEPEWQVVFGCEIEKPDQWKVLYDFVFEADIMKCLFARKGDEYYFVMEPYDEAVAPLMMRYHLGDKKVEATQGVDADMLRFALWIALSMMSASSKMTLVHSSTIVHQGRAVLFLGESGTGKSTHTRLWMKSIPDAHLLNDDSPVLAVENGEAVVYGSPWSGKTHCYHQLRFPLAGVVRLSQAPYNSIRRLSIIEAFSALHPSFPPALAQDDRFQDMLVDMLSEVLSLVPVFHLECLPDEDAAWTSRDAIFKGEHHR
ncbi:MAG: hypothetical protein IKN11_08125 [Bacteroidales bacterium]|nr:hypothetical protein [Bacteroidales bacterium]